MHPVHCLADIIAAQEQQDQHEVLNEEHYCCVRLALRHVVLDDVTVVKVVQSQRYPCADCQDDVEHTYRDLLFLQNAFYTDLCDGHCEYVQVKLEANRTYVVAYLPEFLTDCRAAQTQGKTQ